MLVVPTEVELVDDVDTLVLGIDEVPPMHDCGASWQFIDVV